MSTALRRLFLQQCKGAIVPGQAAADYVQQLVPSLPYVVAPNAVEALPNVSVEQPAPPWSATFVGELSRRKGFDVFLEAIPELLTHFENLSVAGDGPLAGPIRDLASRDARIRYLGFVEGEVLASAILASSVVLVPSRQDPWPLVAVEALTAGRPIVLGPGVGSAMDLQGIAGNAVAIMPAADVESLVQAACVARAHSVPLEVRGAFQPGSIARRFLAIVDGRDAAGPLT